MHKFLRSLAEYPATMVFLCCHYLFDLYITCLTFSFNTAYVYFHSYYFFVCLWSWRVITSAAFRSILSKSRCSLQPKKFSQGTLLPKTPAGFSEHFQTPQLHWHSLRSFFCWLYSLLGSCLVFAFKEPDWRKQATHSIFLKRHTC